MGIRPIVSSCGSLTENISKFVDYWLQPNMIKNIKSFLVRSKLLPSLDCINKTDLPNNISLEYTPIPDNQLED